MPARCGTGPPRGTDGTRNLGPFLDRLVKRQVLECMQGVVVNEDCDWSLCGQDVRGMPDHLCEMIQPGCPIVMPLHRFLRGGRELHESDGLT